MEAKQKSPLSRIVNVKKLHMCHIGVIVILELGVNCRGSWRVAEKLFQPRISKEVKECQEMKHYCIQRANRMAMLLLQYKYSNCQ